MATEFAYSVFDSGSERNKVETNGLNKPQNERKNCITIKRTTAYLIASVATVVLVSSGVCMYLIASRKQACQCVVPERCEMNTHMNNLTTTSTPTRTETAGCPTRWVSREDSCYFFSNESVTWLDAMLHCIKFGGYLSEINSAKEDGFLRRTAEQVVGAECYNKTSDLYKGLVSRTFYDHECQRWDSQFPHKHSRNNISRFPETSLADAANYCRDPDGEGMPWCYTTDPNIRWQFCPVYKCPGNYWIGMSDQTKDSPWTWVTSNTPITYRSYTNWGRGEPSNKAGSYEHCGSLSAEKELAWADQNCFRPAMFICER